MLLMPKFSEDEDILQVSYFRDLDSGLWKVMIGGRVLPLIQGGAFANSGKFIPLFKKQSDGTDTIIDWVNDACKVALFTNTITPNFSTDTAYGVAPWNANETSGTGYTAGGVALAGKTFTESPAGALMADLNDPSWAGSTFGPVRGGLYYDTTLATNLAIAAQTFGTDFSVTAGTLTIQEPTIGLYADDITP